MPRGSVMGVYMEAPRGMNLFVITRNQSRLVAS